MKFWYFSTTFASSARVCSILAIEKKNPEKNSTTYALIVMALVKVVARKKDQKKLF
jgi:hypothetical protein